MVSNILSHDILVIGGGLAGLRAAIEIKKAGRKVAILSKVHPLRSDSDRRPGWDHAALANIPVPSTIAGKDTTSIRSKGVIISPTKMS